MPDSCTGKFAAGRPRRARRRAQAFIELHESLLAKLQQGNVLAATKDLRTIFSRIARLFSAD
jgi:hypothetical protein